MLFSTYKATRVVDAKFLMGNRGLMGIRKYADHFWSRAWNGQMIAWFFPGDVRFWIFMFPICHYYHRYYCANNAEYIEPLERQVYGRWGPSYAEVEKSLSKADQEIVMGFYQWEKTYTFLMPPKLKFRPDGCSLPGAAH